jgi:hypothetical protein
MPSSFKAVSDKVAACCASPLSSADNISEIIAGVAGDAWANAPANNMTARRMNGLPMVPDKGLKLDNNGGPMP